MYEDKPQLVQPWCRYIAIDVCNQGYIDIISGNDGLSCDGCGWDQLRQRIHYAQRRVCIEMEGNCEKAKTYFFSLLPVILSVQIDPGWVRKNQARPGKQGGCWECFWDMDPRSLHL